MPEMSGVELAKSIHTTRPELPVILVTGDGNHEILKESGEARMLQKPHTDDELMEKDCEAVELKQRPSRF
jgi:FixJ family two-component response regulator